MRTYLSGDDAPNRELANYLLGHTGGVGDISQVGSYPLGASPYGTMDMAGNVFEWVNDWWQADYYSVTPYTNPLRSTTGVDKLVRGGAAVEVYEFHVVFESDLRAASHIYGDDPSNYNFFFGFRCASAFASPWEA